MDLIRKQSIRETTKKEKKSAPQLLIILHNVSADLPEIIRVKRGE